VNRGDRRLCRGAEVPCVQACRRSAGSVSAWAKANRQDTTNGRRAWRAYQSGMLRLAMVLRAKLGEARTRVLTLVLARLWPRESVHGPARTARELAARYMRPPLASCLDHVTASPRTGPPAAAAFRMEAPVISP